MTETSKKLLCNEKWRIYIKNQLITKKIGKAIYDETWIERGKRFWIKRWRIPRRLEGSIDWEI